LVVHVPQRACDICNEPGDLQAQFPPELMRRHAAEGLELSPAPLFVKSEYAELRRHFDDFKPGRATLKRPLLLLLAAVGCWWLEWPWLAAFSVGAPQFRLCSTRS
jgi:hypothetical protein